jgi:hypothetical protein
MHVARTRVRIGGPKAIPSDHLFQPISVAYPGWPEDDVDEVIHLLVQNHLESTFGGSDGGYGSQHERRLSTTNEPDAGCS